MKKFLKQHDASVAVAALLAASGLISGAQAVRANDGAFSADWNFSEGFHEVTLGSAIMCQDLFRRYDHPDINYAGGLLRGFYTVKPPEGDGPFRGSFQIGLEAFGDAIYHGPGSHIAGGTLLLRYNFVQPYCHVVPFIEVGGGGTDINIPHEFDGKDFNFNLDTGAGLRWFINSHWSAEVQYRYQHISNANLWSRNVGENTGGAVAGLSYFF